MTELRDLTCIGCPMGCQLHVEMEDGVVKSVTGNTCPKGDAYARKEVTNPTRIVTSTVVIKDGDKPRLSVKTESDVPKSMIFKVMDEINHVVVEAPAKIGDTIIKNVADTGVSVVATRNIEKR
jgi:CxxC motif-containing protein